MELAEVKMKNESGFWGEFSLTCWLLAGMLLPGIAIDYIYLLRNRYVCTGKIVDFFYSILNPLGITYTNAYSIMSSNVGVLLTMVSLFLTMNINIAQRSEKQIMGIPYREIENIAQNKFYKSTRRISYLAPFLMLVVLNLHLCVTGYLLFCHCYGFLIIHYFFHSSSFSTKWARERVEKKLVGCLPQEENWNRGGLREFDMYLEWIGNGVEKEGNWREVELLYDELISLTCNYKAEQKQIILSHFYKIVYWNHKEKNYAAIFRLWNIIVEKTDIRIAETQKFREDDEVVLWVMLKMILYEAEEKQLPLFLEDFLQFKLRSSKTLKTVEKELPEEILCRQVGIIIVLLEYRLRNRLIKEKSMVWYIKRLVDYGEKVFLMQDYDMEDTIKFLCAADEKNKDKFLRIVKELCMDFRERTERCIISSIIAN